MVIQCICLHLKLTPDNTCDLQGLDLPALFAAVESKRESLQIEDYSLSQTTLEQVFVALARGVAEQQQ